MNMKQRYFHITMNNISFFRRPIKLKCLQFSFKILLTLELFDSNSVRSKDTFCNYPNKISLVEPKYC